MIDKEIFEKMIKDLSDLEEYLEDTGDPEAVFHGDEFGDGFDSGTNHAADKLHDLICYYERMINDMGA